MRTVSGSGSSSISLHNLSRSSSRSATRNAAIDLAERGAFFFGQVERDARAEAVDEAVGDLGGDDFVAQPVGADRLGVRLAHRLGEGGEQLRLDQPDRRPACSSSAASCSASLDIDSSTASSGRVRPRSSCAAAQQFVAAAEALDLAVEPARWLRASRSSARSRAAPRRRRASAIDSARRLQPVVLEHQLGDVVGHARRAACCACPASAALRAFRG